MFHGRSDFDQQIASGVDLMIDFATLGEYGLEPYGADGSCRKRAGRRPRPSRRPGWEALATIRRGACGASPNRETPIDWHFPGAARRVDFRAAVERYAA